MNEGLIQDVKDIKEMLVSMQKLEAARVERENAVHEKVMKLDQAVNGNGKPGLKTDVELLKESEKKRAAFQNAIATAVIIQIVLTLILKVF